MKLFRIVDPFTLTLVVTVLLASFFPARGGFVPFFEGLTTAAIALLFFMHGAKLSREAIIAGGSHWRLHLWEFRLGAAGGPAIEHARRGR